MCYGAREWGAETVPALLHDTWGGGESLASCAPSCANGAGRHARVHTLPREWGRMEPGSCALACPTRMGRRQPEGRAEATRRGGAVCPCAPPFRANGEGWGRRVVYPLSAHLALARPHSAQMGTDKREAAAAVGQTWRGGGGADVEWWGVPTCAPLRANGEGKAGGSRAPFPRIQGEEGPGATCPRAPPFRANGVPQTGKDGGGGMPSCAALTRRSGGADGGEGRAQEAGGIVCPISACEGGDGSMRRMGVGGWKGWGKGVSACPLASPFAGGTESGVQRASPLLPPSSHPSPSRLRRLRRKEEARGQAGSPPHPPHHAPPRLRSNRGAPGKGVHEGTPSLSPSPPPPPIPLSAPPIRAEGAHEGRPLLPLLAPPFPIRVEGRTRSVAVALSPSPLAAPPRTRGKGACESTPPLAPTFPFAWKGCAPGPATPSPHHLVPPFPLGRAMQESCTRPTPFAWEGAHEAKPSPPPHVSHSRAGTVSVHPCSSRPHPILTRHSTS
ncbi:hypothetical protein EDB83DRAFT_2317112 [Lactarius deliciosus]|nr:hypothetical protein EDB83DRAFT_2317112 [Lactarius deliciosus]